MSDIIIRPARASDAPQIAAIWNAAIAKTTATFTTEYKTEASLIANIKDRGAGFQVAARDQELLGFATFFGFRDGPGYAHAFEHSIFLIDAAKGQGVGRRLMVTLEEAARAKQAHTLWAAVSGENEAGIVFHQRLGFTQMGRYPEAGRKFNRWLDLVLMQKILHE